jgi:hypothetical protein
LLACHSSASGKHLQFDLDDLRMKPYPRPAIGPGQHFLAALRAARHRDAMWVQFVEQADAAVAAHATKFSPKTRIGISLPWA